MTDELARLRARVAEMEGENATLSQQRDEYQADYLRRHNDACDRFLDVKRLEAEVVRLRTVLDKANDLLDRFRCIGFSPCKDPACYRATLTMMQESNDFLCEHEADLAVPVSSQKDAAS